MGRVTRIKCALSRMYDNVVKKDKGLIVLSIIYMISACMLDIILGFFPKKILDMYINDRAINKIVFVAVFFLLFGSFFGMLSNVIKQISIAKIGYLRIDYLAKAFNKIITCEYKYMEDATFFNKYDSAFDACSNTESGIEKVYNILFDIPALIVKVVVFMIVLSDYSSIVLIMVGVHSLVSFFLGKESATYKYVYREQFSKINRKKRYYNNISQDFQYGKDIRLYHLEKCINERHDKEISKQKKLQKVVKNKEITLKLFASITMILSDIAVYGTLIFKSVNGITISSITMYFIILSMLIKSIDELIVNISGIYGEGLFIADYFDFIDTNLQENQNISLEYRKVKEFDISIRDLCFKYPNTNNYVFKNLNLDIKSGEKIAIVGNNGIGKTTLVKLLLGLFREFEGDILIGGCSIKDMCIENLYKMFSVVFQDANLLAYTIEENITGVKISCDEKNVWNVLQKVGMEERIRQTEKGLGQLVHKYFDEKGLVFSGGESQKLAIARALYKDAPICILDEPTSCLDALAEKEIYEKFKNITVNKTTIFISHRLASTKFCDRIILLDKDGILEQGTHEELMEVQGKYYEMFSLQSQYYKECKYE